MDTGRCGQGRVQKGDGVRCRFVGKEFAPGDPREDLFAGTPPLWVARQEKSGLFKNPRGVRAQLCFPRVSEKQVGGHLDVFERVPNTLLLSFSKSFSVFGSVHIRYTYQTCVQEGLLRLCTNFTEFSVVQCCSNALTSSAFARFPKSLFLLVSESFYV